MSVRITDKSTGAVLGSISEEELQFLNDQLEEESSRDTDYFINSATVDILEAAGGSATLVSMLRQAVGTSEGIDIAWQQT
jgi:inactivated superfamily I helicase